MAHSTRKISPQKNWLWKNLKAHCHCLQLCTSPFLTFPDSTVSPRNHQRQDLLYNVPILSPFHYFFFKGTTAMNWIQRKIYLYNVTFGLYMLDWWERYLFNILIVVLMWFILYNSSKYVTDFCKRYL